MNSNTKGVMTHRERLQTTLAHQQPDRVCVDFGATFVTGIHVSAVTRLRRAVLGNSSYRVKAIEPYQMLGEIDDELRAALGIDVLGVAARCSMFGTQQTGWKPFTMNDGTEVLVTEDFNFTRNAAGDTYMYPEGDLSVPASGHMPSTGYFFDSIVRQEPIDESNLNPADNMEEFTLLGDADMAYYAQMRDWLNQRPDCGAVLVIPGAGFGDIALVPAPFLKHPKGIRDVEEWYVSTALRKDYVLEVFEHQCRIAEQNIRTLIDFFGDRVDVAFITGTDFGTQRSQFISHAAYREMYKPFHVRVNSLIHEKSGWKTFIHSCGSVFNLVPEFIEAGFDILNPVQCSAACMEPAELKKAYGDNIVFWGGGVDTQKTIAFGTPDEVYREVRQRIDVLNKGGGMVFNSIHNIQGNTPTQNILAMFDAIRDSAP
ncbi:MAG: uroporphyrinogen decarboxylase family protein [Pirellulaceae bacterium]